MTSPARNFTRRSDPRVGARPGWVRGDFWLAAPGRPARIFSETRQVTTRAADFQYPRTSYLKLRIRLCCNLGIQLPAPSRETLLVLPLCRRAQYLSGAIDRWSTMSSTASWELNLPSSANCAPRSRGTPQVGSLPADRSAAYASEPCPWVPSPAAGTGIGSYQVVYAPLSRCCCFACPPGLNSPRTLAWWPGAKLS